MRSTIIKRVLEVIELHFMWGSIFFEGPLGKDDLIKEFIRTMGYGRSGAALVDAVDKGIKLGRKTGEIMLNERKRFELTE